MTEQGNYNKEKELQPTGEKMFGKITIGLMTSLVIFYFTRIPVASILNPSNGDAMFIVLVQGYIGALFNMFPYASYLVSIAVLSIPFLFLNLVAFFLIRRRSKLIARGMLIGFLFVSFTAFDVIISTQNARSSQSSAQQHFQAVKKKDTKLCEKIKLIDESSEVDQAMCFEDLAVQKLDISLCDKIKEGSTEWSNGAIMASKARCFSRVAIMSNNTSLCALVPVGSEKQTCLDMIAYRRSNGIAPDVDSDDNVTEEILKPNPESCTGESTDGKYNNPDLGICFHYDDTWPKPVLSGPGGHGGGIPREPSLWRLNIGPLCTECAEGTDTYEFYLDAYQSTLDITSKFNPSNLIGVKSDTTDNEIRTIVYVQGGMCANLHALILQGNKDAILLTGRCAADSPEKEERFMYILDNLYLTM
jgi:hypothetical protein